MKKWMCFGSRRRAPVSRVGTLGGWSREGLGKPRSPALVWIHTGGLRSGASTVGRGARYLWVGSPAPVEQQRGGWWLREGAL